MIIWVKVRSKGVPNRPDGAQRVPGGLGSQISWHSAREGVEVISLTHRPPLPPGMFLVLIFTRGWIDPRTMERSEGNMSLKIQVTPPGIDTGTVRLVAQRLNRYATPDPLMTIWVVCVNDLATTEVDCGTWQIICWKTNKKVRQTQRKE